MGDFIYAISSGGITATNLTTMEESASVELERPSYDYYWYYDDVAVEEVAEEEEVSEEREDTSEADDSSEVREESSSESTSEER